MKMGKFKILVLITLMMIGGLVFSGCESMGDIATGFAYGYSSTSSTGITYTLYNYSSYTITLTAGDYSGTLASGYYGTQVMNSQINMSNIYYSPSDYVSCSVSGTSIYFRDK